jgi:hypothetical protein
MILATLDQIKEICLFILNEKNKKYHIVYVDTHADLRENEKEKIFSITLRGLFAYNFRVHIVSLFKDTPDEIPYNSVFEWVMAFLKGEWIPNEKHLEVMRLKAE